MIKQRKGLTNHRYNVAWAKESLELSHGRPSQRPASGTNQRIAALHQDHYRVWRLTDRRAIKEATIATCISGDWVYSNMQTVAWYPCYIQLFFIKFDYPFEFINKIRFYNNSFEPIN